MFGLHAEPIGAEINVIHEPDILGYGPETAMEKALSAQLKILMFQYLMRS